MVISTSPLTGRPAGPPLTRVNGGPAGRPVKGDVLITIVLPQNRLEARASGFKDVVVAYDGARCHRIGHGETKDRYL